MSTQKLETRERIGATNYSFLTNHDESIAVDGLEDLFKWASEMVSDGEDSRLKRAREHRVRRQVLEVIQRLREQKAVGQATVEIAYLQRRVIALLQKLQDITEENSTIKQMLVAQCYTLKLIPELENEIKRLKEVEWDQQSSQAQQKELLNALSKLKRDRDFLDDLLTTNEEENIRLANLLSEARSEITKLQQRRWWHFFLCPWHNAKV
ncbi:MAG: hypothetical protein HY711_07515 [Candidatus Melainabacteria bacterium]|nr:hypothetical protein [Candidatus Melainabacteria bacterium]